MSEVRWTREMVAERVAAGGVRGIAGEQPADRRQSPGRAEVQADIKPPRERSQLEVRFEQQIAAHGLPAPVTEYFHITGRDFRLDFAWPALRIGVEVQGGAHRVKARAAADIEKRALSLLAGWRVIEVDGAAVRDERGIQWLKQLMGVA
jgi:very-short-patch-repair endonuclease